MSNCKNVCRVCKHMVYTDAITFNGTQVVLQIPAGCFDDCEKVCIVTTKSIPDTATVNAPVVVQIGSTGSVLYPVLKRNGLPMQARDLRTRTKYSMIVCTSSTSAVFKLLGNVNCQCADTLSSINGTAPTAATTDTESEVEV